MGGFDIEGFGVVGVIGGVILGEDEGVVDMSEILEGVDVEGLFEIFESFTDGGREDDMRGVEVGGSEAVGGCSGLVVCVDLGLGGES